MPFAYFRRLSAVTAATTSASAFCRATPPVAIRVSPPPPFRQGHYSAAFEALRHATGFWF